MKTYHVTYFYLATGMEGRADVRDFGHISAPSADEAKNIVAKRLAVNSDEVNWIKGCLQATELWGTP